jgi:hypothetical protein
MIIPYKNSNEEEFEDLLTKSTIRLHVGEIKVAATTDLKHVFEVQEIEKSLQSHST